MQEVWPYKIGVPASQQTLEESHGCYLNDSDEDSSDEKES